MKRSNERSEIIATGETCGKDLVQPVEKVFAMPQPRRG
jgi:hypothetical protein